MRSAERAYRIEKRPKQERSRSKGGLVCFSYYDVNEWDVIGPKVFCACSSKREAEFVCNALNSYVSGQIGP